MVKIMVIGKYPPHKLKELLNVYMAPKKSAYPDFLKKVENWAAQMEGGRYKTYAVYECPDDKIPDAMGAITKRYNLYATVKGYTFKIELLSEADEAIKLLLEK